MAFEHIFQMKAPNEASYEKAHSQIPLTEGNFPSSLRKNRVKFRIVF
jgi:hypothetical protein